MHARLVVTRNDKATRQDDLVLDGSATLAAVTLDGERLGDDGYALLDDKLTVRGVPDSFILNWKPRSTRWPIPA